MPYHADYWMLAGSTSPIVALAAIVSAGSTVAALSGEKRISARLIKGVVYFVCLVNVALQVVVAQAALTGLATSRDAVPLHASTDHVVTGLGLLFASFVGRILAEAYRGAQGKARRKESASAADVAAPGPQPEPEAT
jgi:hypothetical protein